MEGNMDERKTITLRKPSGTVSIFTSMDLLQRKTYDAFLYIAQQQLAEDPERVWFEIDLKTVKMLTGTENDNNNVRFRKMIEDLVRTTIEYNLLHKDTSIEGITSAIHDVEIERSSGKETRLRYALPMRVRNALISRDTIYAVIDLMIKKELQSKYSAILYDLCKDYEKVQVPVMTMEEFKKIFGLIDPETGSQKYSRMVDIRRFVLDAACKELNDNPKVPFTVSYSLIKAGSGNRYEKIKFIIEPKPESEREPDRFAPKYKTKSLESKDRVGVGSLLEAVPPAFRNNGLGVFLIQALDQYGYEYLLKQIEYTNSQNPRNYLAFLKAAVAEDYAGVGQESLNQELEQLREKYRPRVSRILSTENYRYIPVKIGEKIFYVEDILFEDDKVKFMLLDNKENVVVMNTFSLVTDEDKMEEFLTRIEEVFSKFAEDLL